jgi:hypothetical protein
MKKIALALLLAIPCLQSYAQEGTPEAMMNSKEPQRTANSPVIYVTTSTGINNTTGILGFSFEVPIAPYVSLESGAGASTWGDKLYAGAKLYMRPNQRGLAFSVGLTRNMGGNNEKITLQTIYTTNEPVTLRLYPKTNVLFAVYRYFNLGNQYNRFFVGAGWSVNVAGKGWTQTAGTPLSDRSNNEINATAPGGPMLMAGFSFGISRK